MSSRKDLFVLNNKIEYKIVYMSCAKKYYNNLLII